MGQIGIIGAGNMGSALIKGLTKQKKASPSQILIYDIDPAKCENIKGELEIATAKSLEDVVPRGGGILILAVKPQILPAVVNSITNFVSDRVLLISIAAGISTQSILSDLGKQARLIRAMPNAAAMVGESATAICKAGTATDADIETAKDLFSAIGKVAVVGENQMNAVTALSGSGPGYLFPIMEAMSDGGVAAGLDRATARMLVVQTFLGAAQMALSGTPFSSLKDMITSPAGTTIAGLAALEKAGIRGALIEAVLAAHRRGHELDAKK